MPIVAPNVLQASSVAWPVLFVTTGSPGNDSVLSFSHGHSMLMFGNVIVNVIHPLLLHSSRKLDVTQDALVNI